MDAGSWSYSIVLNHTMVPSPLSSAIILYESVCDSPDKLLCSWRSKWALQVSYSCECGPHGPVQFCVWDHKQMNARPSGSDAWLPDGGVAGRQYTEASWSPSVDGNTNSLWRHSLFKRKNLLILNNLIMYIYLYVWKISKFYPILYIYLTFCYTYILSYNRENGKEITEILFHYEKILFFRFYTLKNEN